MLRRHTIRFVLAAALALTLSACGQDQISTDEEAPAAEEQPSPGATVDPNAQFCAEVGRRVSVEDCEDLTRLADEAARGTAAFNAPNPMRRGDVHTLQLAISTEPPAPPAPADVVEGSPPDDERSEAAREIEDADWAAVQEQGTSEAYGGYLAEYPAGEHAAEARAELRRRNAAPPPPPAATPEDVVDPLQGETETFTPLVGRFMRAELTGNGFEITPVTEASQEVLPDSVTTWTWRVEAREGGQRALTLRTVVEGCTADGQCYPLRSTSQNYDVTVQVGPIGQVQDFLMAAPTWLRLLAGVLTALAVLVGAWFGLRNAFRRGAAG
jgi:hypothetical protein